MEKNAQQPVAWQYIRRTDGEVLHYTIESDQWLPAKLRYTQKHYDVEVVPLYTVPPLPRDVLMAALADCREECAKHYLGNDDDSEINLGAISDRYASKVKPEPVAVMEPTETMLDAIKQVRLIDWCCDMDGNPTTVAECSAQAIAKAVMSTTTKPEPVNQQLLAALKDCVDDSRQVLAQDEQIYSESYRPHRIEYQRKVVANAESAIAAAEAAQPVGKQAAPDGWRVVIPGRRHTDKWDSARVADYNDGWNDYQKAVKSALAKLEGSAE